MSVAQKESVQKVLQAAKLRDDNVSERINQESDTFTSQTVLWNENCYNSNTSKTNLQRFRKMPSKKSEPPLKQMETEQQRRTRR